MKLKGWAGTLIFSGHIHRLEQSLPSSTPGNHGDDSGDDDNRLDLHNTQQFMKHNHIRYSISFDPMKKATQEYF